MQVQRRSLIRCLFCLPVTHRSVWKISLLTLDLWSTITRFQVLNMGCPLMASPPSRTSWRIQLSYREHSRFFPLFPYEITVIHLIFIGEKCHVSYRQRFKFSMLSTTPSATHTSTPPPPFCLSFLQLVKMISFQLNPPLRIQQVVKRLTAVTQEYRQRC